MIEQDTQRLLTSMYTRARAHTLLILHTFHRDRDVSFLAGRNSNLLGRPRAKSVSILLKRKGCNLHPAHTDLPLCKSSLF